MRDVVISARRIRQEAWILIGCIVLALAVNAFAIAKFHTPWSELFTAWRETLSLAAVIYIIVTLPRFLFLGAKQLLFRR